VAVIRRCELLVLADPALTAWRRCGRRASASVVAGRIYRQVCSACCTQASRAQAAGLGHRLRWQERQEPEP